MSDIAIKVEGLGKKYTIQHEQGGRYKTLRDTMASTARTVLNRIKHPLTPYDRETAEEFWALKDVSFDIKQGDRVGIIGRNGAGKSTLLKVLSRITEPSTGKITINGRVASLLEVGTGFHPELSGRENIYLNGAILGMKRSEIKRKFDEIVDFAGVEKFLDTPVKRYSSGMYVRLAFAVAAHLEPEILVVDEVLAVGDAEFQKKCLGKMEDVSKKEGRTVLFVSHNMGAVRALCNRGMFLAHGLVVADTSSEDAVEAYISAGFSKAARVEYDRAPNKEISIRAVSMKGVSSRGTLAYDQELEIEVEYEVNEAVTGVAICVSIVNSHNESIISTCDTDTDRSLLMERPLGLHRVAVVIPGKLLNTGTYCVVVGISIPGKHVYDRKEALYYEIIDTGSFVVNGGGEYRRNAQLLLALPWEVKK